jgi:hypothetical protein
MKAIVVHQSGGSEVLKFEDRRHERESDRLKAACQVISFGLMSAFSTWHPGSASHVAGRRLFARHPGPMDEKSIPQPIA